MGVGGQFGRSGPGTGRLICWARRSGGHSPGPGAGWGGVGHRRCLRRLGRRLGHQRHLGIRGVWGARIRARAGVWRRLSFVVCGVTHRAGWLGGRFGLRSGIIAAPGPAGQARAPFAAPGIHNVNSVCRPGRVSAADYRCSAITAGQFHWAATPALYFCSAAGQQCRRLASGIGIAPGYFPIARGFNYSLRRFCRITRITRLITVSPPGHYCGFHQRAIATQAGHSSSQRRLPGL